MLRILLLTFSIWCAYEVQVQGVRQGNTNGDEVVYSFTDTMPEYPGGENALLQYMRDKVLWPFGTDSTLSGKIVVLFVVGSNGQIRDPKIFRGLKGGKAFEEAAIQALLAMPRWKPGLKNGKPVAIQYGLPIYIHWK